MKKNFLLASLIVTLSGCSLFSDDKAEVSARYAYVETTQQAGIKLPDGADSPQYSDEFRVPELGGKAPRNALGENLDIVSPRLVLPVVTGSRVVAGSREAVVEFDQVDDSQPLDVTIWNSLIGFLDDRGIGVVDFDNEQQALKTDWMIIEPEDDSPWYSWNTTERSVGQRFEFRLDVKPHGRSASLFVDLVDYLETVDENVKAEISSAEERRNEIDILNNVISHYESLLRIADARRLKQIQTGVAMQMGFNANGDAAFIVESNYDVAWPRMLLVLRKLGFNVKDLDKSTGLIFVSYAGSDEGWWSGLFGGKEELRIDKTDYRIFASPQGDVTSVTWKDAENNVLTAKTITEIFDPFATVMAQDDLDIQ
ncbi:MAG: outer membrane protein assembly factor BamC [Aestuariibacter sp.]